MHDSTANKLHFRLPAGYRRVCGEARSGFTFGMGCKGFARGAGVLSSDFSGENSGEVAGSCSTGDVDGPPQASSAQLLAGEVGASHISTPGLVRRWALRRLLDSALQHTAVRTRYRTLRLTCNVGTRSHGDSVTPLECWRPPWASGSHLSGCCRHKAASPWCAPLMYGAGSSIE